MMGPEIGMIELTLLIAVFIFALVILNFMLRRGRIATPEEPAELDPKTLADDELRRYLRERKKINAIKRYRELTGTGLKVAKEIVESLLLQDPDDLAQTGRKQRSMALSDEGIRDLLRDGRRQEAVDLYAKFVGVDVYSAEDAVDAIEREMRLGENAAPGLSVDALDDVRDLLRRGNRLEAVKRYREITGASLKEAKDEVDAMDRLRRNL